MSMERSSESRKSAKMSTKDGGRVLVWHTSKEADRISLAVPGDRATLTRDEALEIAAELTVLAQGMPQASPVPGSAAAWSAAEAARAGMNLRPWAGR